MCTMVVKPRLETSQNNKKRKLFSFKMATRNIFFKYKQILNFFLFYFLRKFFFSMFGNKEGKKGASKKQAGGNTLNAFLFLFGGMRINHD